MPDQKALYNFIPEEITPPKEVWYSIQKVLECNSNSHIEETTLSTFNKIALKKKKVSKLLLVTAAAALLIGIIFFISTDRIPQLEKKAVATMPISIQSASHGEIIFGNTFFARYRIALGPSRNLVKISRKLEQMADLVNNPFAIQTKENQPWLKRIKTWELLVMGTSTNPVFTNFSNPIDLIQLAAKSE